MTTSLGDAATAFVGVTTRTQTYRNLLYLLLAFPLGVAYFVVLTTGLSVGVGLAITVFGAPILLATLGAAYLLTNVEAALTNRLLGTDVPRASLDTDDGLLAAAKRLVTAPRTWLGVLYLFGKSVFGLVAFVALTTLLSVSVSMLAAPLTYSTAYRIGLRFGTTSFGPFESGALVVNTFPQAVGVAVAGLVVGVVSLHLLNGLARVSGAVTESLFTPSESE